MFFVQENFRRGRQILYHISRKAVGKIHILRWIELIGDLYHALKTNDLGNILIHHPDHIDGAANTDNGGGSLDIKSPFLEFQQVFCEHLQLA